MEDWSWLASTRRLQEESFGVDYDELGKDGEAIAHYVLWNAYALADELHEFTNEIQWKPWAKDRGVLNRDAAVGEMVDLLHFVANLLSALDVTDDELWERYREKQARNAARQAAGYDARANKCPSCKRELDKAGAVVFDQLCDFNRCAGCGCPLDEGET